MRISRHLAVGAMQMATLFLLVTLMEIVMTTGSVTIATAKFALDTTHSSLEVGINDFLLF